MNSHEQKLVGKWVDEIEYNTLSVETGFRFNDDRTYDTVFGDTYAKAPAEKWSATENEIIFTSEVTNSHAVNMGYSWSDNKLILKTGILSEFKPYIKK